MATTLIRNDLAITLKGSAGSATGVLVGDASFNFAAQSESRRSINSAPEWAHRGPQEYTATLNGTLNETWATLLPRMTGESSGFFLNCNGVSLSGCHLEEFELRGATHSPISLRANFKTWAIPSGSFNSASGLTAPDSGRIYHSAQSTFGATGITFPDDFIYRVQCERIPRFVVGSYVPNAVRSARLERELSLRGKNVSSFVNYDGGTGSASFVLRYNDAQASNQFSDSISGNVNQQDFQLENQMLVSITIKSFVR